MIQFDANDNACGEILTGFGSDKDTRHSYGPVYESLFSELSLTPIDLLEIGILNGNSLLAWGNYFPLGRIIGVDRNQELVNKFKGELSTDHVQAACANSTDRTSVGNVLFGHMFDVVIDDGSHWLDDQRDTLNNVWPFVKSGGIYVIEDVQHLEWAEQLVGVKPGGEILDLRAVKGTPDDIMVIFRKE